MNKVINKFLSFIGLVDDVYLKLYDFFIGDDYYIILELPQNDGIVKNKILDQVLCMSNCVYWFKNFFELESYGDLIINKNEIIFIIIG